MTARQAYEAARAATKFANEVFSIAEHPELAPVIARSGIVAELRRQIAKMAAFVDALEEKRP